MLPRRRLLGAACWLLTTAANLDVGNAVTLFLRSARRCDCDAVVGGGVGVALAQQPCPCMTTPAPPEKSDEEHIQEAILNETRIGLEKIQLQSLKAGKNATDRIVNMHMEEYNKTAVPELERISEDEISKTRPLIEAEKEAHLQAKKAIEKVADADEAANRKAVAQAAKEFSQAEVGNALAAASEESLSKAFVEEKTTEAMRVEALEFSHSALKAANESLQLAEEAEAASDRVAPEEVKKVDELVHELKDEAGSLEAQAAKASQISVNAGSVMQSVITLNSNTLQHAYELQVKAQKAHDLAAGNAKLLGELHERAQRVGIVSTEASAPSR